MSAAVVTGVLLEVAAGVVAAFNARLGAGYRGAPDQASAAWLGVRWLLLQMVSVALAFAGLLSMREDLGWWGLVVGMPVLLVTTTVVARLLRRRARARR